MDIAIDYYSPAIFGSIVAAFFAFFILFRNYRLHLNALFGVISVFASIWFFLFYLSDTVYNSDIVLYAIALSAVMAYFLFLLLHRQETLKTNIKRILPEGYLLFPAWISFIMGMEVLFIGLALFVYILSSSDILNIPNFVASTAELLAFTLSFIFLAENVVLAFISAARLLMKLKSGQKRLFEYFFVCLFGLFWLIFSLSTLFISIGSINTLSFQINSGLATLATTSLLGIILFQAVIISRRYYLSLKVLITQLIATLIVIFNLISLLNSGSVEEIALRAILIIVLAFLSHLLVRSVVSEIQKRQRIQDTAQEIYEANKKLHKLDRAKSDFIASASHQLRSPLSVVKGIGSMLLDGSYGKLSDSIKDALEKVYISNERLIGLIESLLNISHLDEGKVDFNFAKINLNDIAKKAVEGLSLQARNKKLYLKFSPFKKAKLLVWADESKVTEAISNLIDNAIKYTRKGGVSIEVRKLGNNARVIVKDTGIGLEKDEIGHLFQKFVRAGRGNKLSTVGTGLGLYVVRKMIEAHKGKIWAESTGEGRGSSFVIELPLNLKTPPDEKFIKSVVMEKKPA